MFQYNENSQNQNAETAIKEYLSHVKRVKEGKEKENPRFYKKAEEEISKAMPNRQSRRMAIKALKHHPEEALEFLQSSTLTL